ncbi:hypothetical protein QBC40DRAFT_278555 [Triangularia verruculosa]|uniref:Rhodopsin domain-containing protein n=1 Tax=Triangularia verruculosa TaxID=2587418 RepID=A0AAN6XP29_9PEZI|nr:hypothetical protein QBC40DRAFT_278555 [Triangularia verruculosa]
MQLVSTLCVALRFYSRKWKRQQFITSDWLILAAWVFGTGLSVLMLWGVSQKAMGYPLGGTIDDPAAVNERLNRAKHSELSYLLIGVVALGLIKLSVCFLYWHLFSTVMFRRFLIFWMVALVLWTLAFVLAGLLECGTHLTAIFGTPEEYYRYCQAAMPSGFGMVASDILTDIITVLIPIPVIMKLQMNKRTRVLTLLVFSIAGLSVGASIAKAYIYITATQGLGTEDAISILTGIGIWNLVEVQVGIIAACGPTLRAILSRILPIEAATISLLSFLGVTRLSSSKSDTLPSFVKRPSTNKSKNGNISHHHSEDKLTSFATTTRSTVTAAEYDEHETVRVGRERV